MPMDELLNADSEYTLVNYFGQKSSSAGINRESYSERDRVQMLSVIAKRFPMARVVRLNDKHLGICIDFNHLYAESEELQETDMDSGSVLESAYAGFQAPPASFSQEAVESWVRRHFQSFTQRWNTTPGVATLQITNPSFVEYRVYVAETSATIESLMDALATSLNQL